MFPVARTVKNANAPGIVQLLIQSSDMSLSHLFLFPKEAGGSTNVSSCQLAKQPSLVPLLWACGVVPHSLQVFVADSKRKMQSSLLMFSLFDMPGGSQGSVECVLFCIRQGGSCRRSLLKCVGLTSHRPSAHCLTSLWCREQQTAGFCRSPTWKKWATNVMQKSSRQPLCSKSGGP